jgi:hypothetical protein
MSDYLERLIVAGGHKKPGENLKILPGLRWLVMV